jgi:subtilisin-like proprotein convertase family protein
MPFARTVGELLNIIRSLRRDINFGELRRRNRATSVVSRQVDALETRALLAATVSLSAGAGSISEAGGSTTLTATLSEPATEDVVVNLETTGTAVSNTDYRMTSTTAPITIDGDFSDWANNPAIVFGTDPLNDTHDTETGGAGSTPSHVDHPDADLRAFGVTHDDENLYFYFRSEGQIGRTQVADAAQGKIAGRFYVIVTMDVDQNDVTGYPLHEGGYYPTTPGYDMNSEVEFYGGTFNTGNYLNHGATDQASLDQAFAEQSNGGYDPAQAAQDIQGPFTPGFVRVLPGTYEYYTQWVYTDNDPANGGNDSITFVKDKGPIVNGIIQQQISADGHELEMIVPYKGFLVDQNGDPIVDVGSILDLSFSLEASGELAPGQEWASDTADPLNGYALTPSSSQTVSQIRIPKGQTSASVTLSAANNQVVAPGRTAIVRIGDVTGATINGPQQVAINILNDDPPSIVTTVDHLEYDIDSPAVVIDPGLSTVVPSGSVYTGARVSIGAGYEAGHDVLRFESQGGISGDFDSATGVLTLAGTTDPATYEAALRSVTYQNSGGRPVQPTRLVTFTVSSGTLSKSATRTIQLNTVEAINVNVVADSISEAAGPGATMVRVSRSDIFGPFSVPLTQSFSNVEIFEIPDTKTIYSPIVVPAQASGITDVDVTVNFQHEWLGDLDVYLISPRGTRIKLFTDLLSSGNQLTGTILDDQAGVSILAGSAPYTGHFTPQESLSGFDMESPAGTWLLEVTDDNSSHFGSLLGWTLSLKTLGLQAATVVLQTSNVDKAGFHGNATTTVVIPANQAEVFVPLDAVDNSILDGNSIVTIKAISVDIADLELGSDTVTVKDSETLAFTTSVSSVSEAISPSVITGTLTRRNTDIGSSYTVQITSSNPGKLSVTPATVTFAPDQSSKDFTITVHDNATIDGDVIVTLTATAPEYGDPVTVQINVLDYEPKLLLTTASVTVAENVGSIPVKVQRVGVSAADLSNSLVVQLTPVAGLNVPATVTIPPNMSEWTFSVGVNDNSIIDGTRTARLTATLNLYISADLDLTITDHEFLTLSVDKSSFLENAGSEAATAVVRRSDTDDLSRALVVSLESSDATELRVPATVTIPAGQTSVTFFVEAMDDSDIDGPRNVTITAASANYVTGSASVAVLDHEPPVLTGPAATTTESRPTISWNAVPGTLRYDVWIDNLSSGAVELLRNTNVPTTSWVPPENLGIGRYRVWVRAINQLEQPGFWSNARDFVVNTRATITSPKQNEPVVTGTFPAIVWSAVPGATKYEVWVDNITSGRIPVVKATGASALSTTSYLPTPALGSGTYQIWVRGLNAAGEGGLWSHPVTYRVVATPTIAAPEEENTFDRTPTFAWTAISGASNYDVWIGDAKTNKVVIRDKFVTSSSFTPAKDMDFGQYRIWVRAQNGDSVGGWSLATTFSVGVAPTLTDPPTIGTSGKPQFSWTGVAQTEEYEIWIDKINENSRVRVLYQTDITATTYTVPTALPSGSYRVWIRAISRMGEATTWSAPVNFTISLTAPSLDSAEPLPTDGLASQIVSADLHFVQTDDVDRLDPVVSPTDEQGGESRMARELL